MSSARNSFYQAVGTDDDFLNEPMYEGYQLIGDSQFLRFSEQMLHLRRRKNNGIAYLGLCVSGQTTSDLLKRITSNFHPVHSRVVLMIGTNDIMKNTNLTTLKHTYNRLISELLYRGVEKLILLTIPPVPRLTNSASHWHLVTGLNEYIRSISNGKDIIVIDGYKEFVRKGEGSISSDSYDKRPLHRYQSKLPFHHPKPNAFHFPSSIASDDDHNDRFDDADYSSDDGQDKIRMEFFEQFFAGRQQREDNIHLNCTGLHTIQRVILEELWK